MASEHKTYELTVELREERGKTGRKLRRRELVPGIVYGHRVESESVQVASRELERVYLRAGNTTLIDLKLGDGAPRKVFIYGVQRDPVTQVLQHVDFMVVNLREEMTASVAVVLTGESEPVAREEAVLIHGLDHVQVRALPADLPPVIEVDISRLIEVGDTIHVSDLEVPENVALLTNPEEMVARLVELRVEEVEEAPEAEAEEGEAAEGEGEEGGAGESEEGEESS